MRILQVTGYGVQLRIRDGGLVIYSKEDGKRRVPISDIDLILIQTSGVSITSNVIRKLVRAGVDIVFVDYRGHPVATVYSSEPTLTVQTKRSQYAAYLDGRGAGLAIEFAYSKIYNQSQLLAYFYNRIRKRILREALNRINEILSELKEVEDNALNLEEIRSRILQLEARAAREYWGAISRILPGSIKFIGRNRDYDDPVNIVLNYSYGILYPIVWRALLLAGLDPYAGYLHVDRSGKPVLSFDYIECWRPVVVDRQVIQWFLAGWRPKIKDDRLSPESRREIVEMIKKRLDSICPSAYRRMTCSEAIRGYALRLAKAIREGNIFRCYRGL